MLIFTTQEQILLCIYDAGSRAGTLAQLRDMMGELTDGARTPAPWLNPPSANFA